MSALHDRSAHVNGLGQLWMPRPLSFATRALLSCIGRDLIDSQVEFTLMQ